MKTKLGITLILLSSASFGSGTLRHYEYNVRCSNYEPKFPGGLTNEQAPGRQDWGLHCSRTNSDVTFILERLKYDEPGGKVFDMYPVFGVPIFETKRGRQVRAGGTNPKEKSFPLSVDEDAKCEKLPEDYSVVAMCRASCYTKTVQVLTPDGFYAAEEFHNTEDMDSVISISKDSKIGKVITEPRKITAKISSLVEGEHNIFIIKTDSGKRVELTSAHPLVTGSGHFVSAENVKVGSSLMNEFGDSEKVISVKESKYFGKVYNVSLHSENKADSDKVFVLNGLLSGDADIQNDDTARLRRALNKWINTPEEI